MRKTIRRFAAVLLLAATLATACTEAPDLPSSPSRSSDEGRELSEASGDEDDRFQGYGRSFLEEEACRLYDDFVALARTGEPGEGIPAPRSMTDQALMTLLGYVMDDNPSLYGITPCLLTDGAGGRAVSFRMADGMDRDLILRQRAAIVATAGELVEGLDSLSPMERVIAVHDRLAGHITYDIQTDGLNLGNVYGGLVNGSGVCDAYAKSFQYLMGELGIPCAYIRGTDARGRSHAWNAVCLEDGWRYVDVTWDDKENLRHNYLCVGGEAMAREHQWDDTQYPSLPPEAGDGQDYYAYQEYTVAPGGQDQVLEDLARVFADQLQERAAPGVNPVFLEVRVTGDARGYEAVKSMFMDRIFSVRSRVDAILATEEEGIRIRQEERVECNFNDAMQILSFFPEVDYR